MKKINKINKFPAIKKDIKDFLASEEGRINREDVAKIALKVVAAGVVLSAFTQYDKASALGTCVHSSHASHASHGSHSSHGSHGSHGSHSSHGSHGSHGSHSNHSSHGSHGSHGSHSSHSSKAY